MLCNGHSRAKLRSPSTPHRATHMTHISLAVRTVPQPHYPRVPPFANHPHALNTYSSRLQLFSYVRISFDWFTDPFRIVSACLPCYGFYTFLCISCPLLPRSILRCHEPLPTLPSPSLKLFFPKKTKKSCSVPRRRVTNISSMPRHFYKYLTCCTLFHYCTRRTIALVHSVITTLSNSI